MILNQVAYGGAGGTPSDWIRPVDWPALPALADNTFHGLIAVQDLPQQFLAVTASATGGITVNWGDGTTDTWSSNGNAQHQYDYASLAAPVTARGYKTALVTVTTTTPGASMTAFNLQKRHSSLLAAAESGWLDIQIQAPSMTGLTIGNMILTTQVSMLEQVRIGTHNLTNMMRMLQNCRALQSVPLFDTSNVTNPSHLFNGCGSLRVIPPLDLRKAQDASYMFSGCGVLVTVPALDLPAATNVRDMFVGDLALAKVPYLHIPHPSIIYTGNLFTGTTISPASLAVLGIVGVRTSLDLTKGALSATQLNAVYSGLADVKAYTLTGVTGNGAAATYTTSIAHYMCVGQMVTTTGMTPSGYNVTNKLVTAVTADTFTVDSTETGTYVSGGTIAAQGTPGITVTGNFGAGSSDKTIATNKGWTVVA